jgi:predicted regulator of Ras-like GTPase activity (Roadblock/LC7/MglB family)
MASIEEMLRTLRDVEGVYGSFVIAGTGGLVASDLPAIFDADLFAEVGPRITRLYDTFRSSGEELDGCVLRYAEHKLYLRSMTWGLIGILSAVAVNKPALRMVVNLVIRRIDPEVVASLRPSFTPTPPPVAASLSRPASSSPPVPPPLPRPVSAHPKPAVIPVTVEEGDSSPPTSSPPVRMYRGRPVTNE